jgi:hypothetical protein
MNELNFKDRFVYLNNQVYLPEHQNPFTIFFHILGSLLGLLLVPLAYFLFSPFWILTFPIVHGFPGILAHKFFERNEKVGDLRINRKDYPLLWFIFANHILTFQIVFYLSKRELK